MTDVTIAKHTNLTERLGNFDTRFNRKSIKQIGCPRARQFFTALILLISSSLAPADSEHEKGLGVYLGVGAGLGYLNPRDDRAEIRVQEQKDLAGQIFLGLDINHRFGTELQYTHLGTADLTDDATIRYREASFSGLIYGFNTLENLSKRTGLYGFGRVGVGKLFTKATGVEHRQDNDYHLLLGAGAEYGFSNGLAIRGEYLSYDHDAKYIQLSLLYRLARKSPEQQPIVAQETVTPIIAAAPDEDADLVTDSNDLCPGTAPGTTVDDDGCPVYDDIIKGVNFYTNSADLTTEAKRLLDDAAAELHRFPHIAVNIMAHTDSRGPEEYNLDLSRRRAASVAAYLSSKRIDSLRLIPQAFGESRPIATNATSEGRYANRRVEFDTFSQP